MFTSIPVQSVSYRHPWGPDVGRITDIDTKVREIDSAVEDLRIQIANLPFEALPPEALDYIEQRYRDFTDELFIDDWGKLIKARIARVRAATASGDPVTPAEVRKHLKSAGHTVRIGRDGIIDYKHRGEGPWLCGGSVRSYRRYADGIHQH